MRGPISDSGDILVGGAYWVSGPVLLLYYEDSLFLELCGVFDELFAFVVTVLDCFPVYLDLWLVLEDFLAWQVDLVGVELDGIGLVMWRWAQIVGVVAGYWVKGTVVGLRVCAADVVGVLIEWVGLAEGGGVAWVQSLGTVLVWPHDSMVVFTIAVSFGRDWAALIDVVRDAVAACLPIWCRL